MHVFVDLAIRFPKLAGLIGLFVAICFGALGISSYLETQKIGDAPQEATLAETAEYLAGNDRYWVIVTDGSVNCDSIHSEQVGSTTSTEIFIESPDRTLAMLVAYSPQASCDAIKGRKIRGVAYKMSEKHKDLLDSAGRLKDYPTTTRFLELCTTCGRPSSTALIFLAAIFVPLGLSLYPLALWARKYQQRKTVSTSADDVFEK